LLGGAACAQSKGPRSKRGPCKIRNDIDEASPYPTSPGRDKAASLPLPNRLAAMSEKMTVVCLDFKARCSNTLRGFATVRIEQLRLVVREIAIHAKGDKAWAQLPARPWIRNGQVVTNDDGKVQYSPLFEFDTALVRTAFSDAVIRAVLAFDPRALECRQSTA
jgi:hypothetical protein